MDEPSSFERLFTLAEVAEILRWSYDSTKRYFRRVDGILRRPGIRTSIRVPESVLRREWDKLTRKVSTTAMPPQRLTPKRATLTDAQWQEILAALDNGESVSSIAKRYKITRQAIYKRLKD
jgi:hypothetical protein